MHGTMSLKKNLFHFNIVLETQRGVLYQDLYYYYYYLCFIITQSFISYFFHIKCPQCSKPLAYFSTKINVLQEGTACRCVFGSPNFLRLLNPENMGS